MKYIKINEASICWEVGTLQLLPYSDNGNRVVTMLHSNGQQGQLSLREALTVATTGGHSYMKRCYDNMRSERLNMAGKSKRIYPLPCGLTVCKNSDRYCKSCPKGQLK